MLFDVLTPERILFGPGSTYRLGEEVAGLGRRALLVTGRQSLKQTGNIERITQPLTLAGIETVWFEQVPPEPSTAVVDEGRRKLTNEHCTVVIGVGGGSALDTAKAIAGLAVAEGAAREYLRGREITAAGLPFVAVPTTAGSGSEVTRNAVLIDDETGTKSSLRHERWMARVAIVDPILTMSMPTALTAQTALDALTHAIEAYTSRWATAYSSGLSREAVRLIIQNIYTACTTPRRRDARENMLQGSLLAGMALNAAGVGLVHALAHPVGRRYGLGHGLVCGVLLAHVMEFNSVVAEGEYAALSRFAGLVPAATPDTEAAARLLHFIRRLTVRLGLPERLEPLGLKEDDLAEIAETAMGSSSLAANRRKATRQDVIDLLRRTL